MDRNREARRGSTTGTNGVARRRHRNSAFRDSPEEDVSMEFQETARLRDRGSKKDRDRDRDRLSRNKRRRCDRLMHGSIREEGAEDSTEESVDDDEEEEDEDGGAARMLPPNLASSSSVSNLQHRKSFPPGKILRNPSAWKVADEMIGVSVPRKARSASAKRLHDGCVSGEHIHRQASTSPARSSVAACSPASASPSSSNASLKKKMKHMGPKQKPPRISKSSSVQDEIEIEIAEVLYGLMRQSQSPKQEISTASQKPDSKDAVGSSNETKSRVSSPASPQVPFQPSSLHQNSSSSTAIAPKRKRPRPAKNEEDNSLARNGPVSSVNNVKAEISSPKTEKNPGSTVENGEASASMSLEPQSELIKPDSNTVFDAKPLNEESERRDRMGTEEEAASPKKESSSSARSDVDPEDISAKKTITTATEVESQREKFKIDLMAPPLKSSPERDSVVEFESDKRPVAPDIEMKAENGAEEEFHAKKIDKDACDSAVEEKKTEEMVAEEAESHKLVVNRERTLDLQLDLEKQEKDSSTCSVNVNKLVPPIDAHHQESKVTKNDPKGERNAQSTSVPLPMTLAGWPGGLPSFGYMPPVQTVMPMEGSAGSLGAVQPPHSLLSQSRPKRCATHFYIARTICYHQQFTRMNPFWPTAAGSGSLYGAKPYNLNVSASTETPILGNPMQGIFPVRNAISPQDKGQTSATLSGNTGNEKGSVAANFMDAAQRKQPVLQKAPPPSAPSNLLPGPAYIFPLSQQQAGATAATRSGPLRSATTSTNAASSSPAVAPAGTPISCPSTAAAGAATMSFNYPNLPANEAQYVAIYQNNGYPFPIPPLAGAPSAYRGGTPPQAIPYFNAPFYSSQMLHPSQLHQQQQQQPHTQPQPIQQGHQNTSTSSGSSSSQKHQQAQQQRLPVSGSNGGGGSSQSFPASKNGSLPTQHPLHQQQNPHLPPFQARQLDGEIGGEDSPSTADSRVSHVHKGVYGQGFAMPFHPHNYALMNPTALGAAAGGGGNHGEKQLQAQHQGFKGGVELVPSQAFAMSFASYNGSATAPGIDFSSMAQNHAIFQSLPEAARHSYHMAAAAAAAAAAQAAQQKKGHQIFKEGKPGGDSSNADDERKGLTGKAMTNVGQSLAFSRPETNDSSVSAILSNTGIDSSARTLNLISAPVGGNRASRSINSTVTTANAAAIISNPNSQQQQQIQLQKQQQQQMQHQLQQQLAAAAVARSKTSTASGASVYSDRLPSSSLVAKFPNAVSVFPQAHMQAGSPAQSTQWKNSARTTTSQMPPQNLASSSASSLKNISQQQGRAQHGHTQISFGVNTKSATPPQGQQPPINNQPSSSMAVGSPPTSSVSKNTGGSPRTASTGSKASPASTLSSKQTKTSSSGPSRKSSPVGGRNVPSILSNAHVSTPPSSGAKSQLQQQQHQQQQMMQKQAQFFFSTGYMQAQSPQSSTTPNSPAPANPGYYHQRRQPEHQSQQQQQSSSTTSSTGMLSLCPASLSLAGATTSDPTKAAANNLKGSGLPQTTLVHAAQFATQSVGNPHQLISAAFPYMHPVPNAVQVKPAEQKQPAGNDNLHACWQPEKRR